MQNLLASPHLSDATIIVEGVRIPAHRQVLAMHSRVFDRMWAHTSLQEVSAAACIDMRAHNHTLQANAEGPS